VSESMQHYILYLEVQWRQLS